MKASALSFQAAVVFVICGMVWGIIMAISRDHSAMPAHAHLSLLGWVSLFLFGIYYRLHPALETAKAAMVQVLVWMIGTVIFRTTLASWAEEAKYRTNVIQALLAHRKADDNARSLGSQDVAYMRATLFEERRALHVAWAAYVTS
jgi:hypothetical protein